MTQNNIDNYSMVKVGALVRVIYPDYAAGRQGRIQAQEATGRWIVKLEQPLQENGDSILLSLEETDFVVIQGNFES